MNNPIGLVPKTNEEGKNLLELDPHNPSSYRIISDLRKSKVNLGIVKEKAKVEYVKFDRVVQHCHGPGCYLAKTDISSAFSHVPIHPSDWHLLGMTFQGQYYVDKCLPFGLSTSCAIFESISTAIEAVVTYYLRDTQFLNHYLDDFIGSSGESILTDDIVDMVIRVCTEVGLPIAHDKTFWASRILKFLGLLVDTVQQMVFIPDHKVRALKEKLELVLHSKTIRVRTLHSLSGSLNFYSNAKPGGRTFIRRIYNAQMGKPLHHYVPVSSQLKKDLRMWLSLLEQTKLGTPFLDVLETPALDIDFYSDASSEVGWGCFFRGQWAQGRWDHAVIQARGLTIAWLELYALTVGIYLWGHSFTGKRVIVNCDNTASVGMVNKQTSPCPKAMILIRMLFFSQLKFDYTLKAQHIKSEHNGIADSLSHFQDARFTELWPWAEDTPCLLPRSLSLHSEDIWMLY